MNTLFALENEFSRLKIEVPIVSQAKSQNHYPEQQSYFESHEDLVRIEESNEKVVQLSRSQ